MRPDLLQAELGPGARGYFTTRGARGGRPPGGTDSIGDPYAGFNLAAHVGDRPEAVQANRRALEEGLGLAAPGSAAPGAIAWMNQVHSALVARAQLGQAPTADALILDTRNQCGPHGRGTSARAVGVLVADCVPLLLATSQGTLVAAVHAGRRGMLDGVVTAAVAALVAAGADPSDLWAATGPSICGNCYEVSEDMAQQAAAVEPACRATSRWGTPAIDVAAGVHAQLERAGVGHMHPGHWCTAEDERFFSYRRQGATGRIAGVAIAGRTAGGQAGASSVTRRGQ
ncbi:polyphenol oxidase family protein [Actinomyces oricola]